jgi:hypothetical protein
MKKTTLSILGIFAVSLCIGQPVTVQEAATVAGRFLESQGKTLVSCAKITGDEHDNLLYFFNAENAFVVVAGDKSVEPVLAYVDHQTYNDADAVAPFEMWIDHYARQIEQVKKQHIVQPAFVKRWEAILDGAPAFRTDYLVEPLILSRWDQGEYYNYYCPRDPAGINGHVVTGCVATAMAQLIYYYRFPETGVGSYSYTDENYGVQSADYGAAVYDYNAMCDVPTAINPEICKLIYHFGVGVDMHYSPGGSGMYNHSAARVLRTFFKYSPETEYLYRDSTDLNWDSVIVSHLNRRMPLYYAGWSLPNINGHGFICDGYKHIDSSYLFHFNFGWGGYMDGDFYTSSLIVGSNNFNLAQELIINAYPDTAQYVYPVAQPLTGGMTLTAPEGTFTDGAATAAACPAGMDYTWEIAPETSNLTGVSLTLHYQIAAGDTLYVSNPGVNTFEMRTADTGTLSVNWGTTTLTVNLRTHSDSSEGFRAHYTSEQEIFCSGVKLFNSPTGTITDGSGDNEYNNFTNCRFRIILNHSNAIAFHINAMDIEPGHDFLHFYRNTVSEANYMMSLTGHITDSSFVVDANRLMLVFETDERVTGSGFSIDYTGGFTGVEDYEETWVHAYPNPVADRLTLNAATPIRSVEIRNTENRTIRFETPHSESATLLTNSLSPGIYFLVIRTDDSVITRKIIKL